MTPEIKVALISGGVTLLTALLSFLGAIITFNKKTKEENKKHLDDLKQEFSNRLGDIDCKLAELNSAYNQAMAIIELKIDNLEKKQDKHNEVIERTYKLERDVAVLKTEVEK